MPDQPSPSVGCTTRTLPEVKGIPAAQRAIEAKPANLPAAEIDSACRARGRQAQLLAIIASKCFMEETPSDLHYLGTDVHEIAANEPTLSLQAFRDPDA